MRIEIDTKLAKILDEIKQREPTIFGRGHVETVRFLANYYRSHEPLQVLIEDLSRIFDSYLKTLDSHVEAAISHAFLRAMRHAISSLFETKDENRPVKRSAGAPGIREEGR